MMNKNKCSKSGDFAQRNMINPYTHLLKMLDAAYLIVERRGKK